MKTRDEIRNISVEVYKLRLEAPSGGGHGAVERMLAKDADGGKKLRERAASYDTLTRCYLKVMFNEDTVSWQ